MAKDEKGFFDWLVEDICNTIEIKGAVEATRGENGKADKWAALGLTMGLGHTSDDDIATLFGFLGADGAFDDDEPYDDVYIPPIPIDEPVLEPSLDEENEAIFREIDAIFDRLDKIAPTYDDSAEEHTADYDETAETDEEDEEAAVKEEADEFENTLIGTNLVYADDMRLLYEAGYDELDLELMEPKELKEAMEYAGVDTMLYDFYSHY